MGPFLCPTQHTSTSAPRPPLSLPTRPCTHLPSPARMWAVCLPPRTEPGWQENHWVHTSVTIAVKSTLQGKKPLGNRVADPQGWTLQCLLSHSAAILLWSASVAKEDFLHARGPHHAAPTPHTPCVYSVHFMSLRKPVSCAMPVPREARKDEQASVPLIRTCTSHTCPSRLHDTTVRPL